MEVLSVHLNGIPAGRLEEENGRMALSTLAPAIQP